MQLTVSSITHTASQRAEHRSLELLVSDETCCWIIKMLQSVLRWASSLCGGITVHNNKWILRRGNDRTTHYHYYFIVKDLPFIPRGMNVAFYAHMKHSLQTCGLLRNCCLTLLMYLLVFTQNHNGCVLYACVSAGRFVTLSATLTRPLRWRIPPLITCFANSYKGLKWCPRSSRTSAKHVNSRAKLLVVPVL